MKFKIIYLLLCLFTLPLYVLAKDNKKEDIPPVQDCWNNEKADGDRSLSNSPSLFKDANSVYVYSEKQLDNLTIGITDMQGNVYYQEVTNIPAGMYYAISIESLPVGQYYLCIYQGSNYVIGTFIK